MHFSDVLDKVTGPGGLEVALLALEVGPFVHQLRVLLQLGRHAEAGGAPVALIASGMAGEFVLLKQ